MNRDELYARAREEHEAFLSAIGELTLAWSDLETVLYKLLKHYSGVTDPVGRAIFSGTRAKTMIEFVRAIAENTNMEVERRNDLEEIFAQVATINSARDFVVHHVDGSVHIFESGDPSTRVVTNAIRASRFSKRRRAMIGSQNLIAMATDCVECCWRLHAHWDQANMPFRAGPGTNGIRSPWCFKPVQLAPGGYDSET